MSDKQKAVEVPIPATGGTDEDMTSTIDLNEGRRKFNFFQRFLDGWINSAIAISCLSIALIVSLLANMFLVIMLGTKFEHEKVVLVPANLSKTIHVRTGQVTPEFMREIALIVATLYATFTPKTVVANIEGLLDYASPNYYNVYAKALRKNALQAKRTEMAQVFTVRDIQYKDQSVFVRGIIRRYSFGKMVDMQEDALLTVTMAFNPTLNRITIDQVGLYDSYNDWLATVTKPTSSVEEKE